MSSQTQVQDVQQQIEGVNDEVSEVKASLAAAKKDGDKEEVRSLYTQLEQLYKERVVLRDKENLLLRAQQGGGRLSLSHHVLLFSCVILNA